MHSSLIWALALAGSASAAVIERGQRLTNSPTTASNVTSPTESTEEPCAIASRAAASYLAANPTETPALIAPSVGYACLNSIPLDEERDSALLDYWEPYIVWQSTLEVLSNPPEGYLIPGVDILGGLSQIRAKLSSGGYSGQYEFITDFAYLVSLSLKIASLQPLIAPCVVCPSFRRPLQLFSSSLSRVRIHFVPANRLRI